MEFALVPKGKSWLGGGKGKEGPNEVNMAQDFYLGVYEVTQEEWQKVMGKNPSHFTPQPSSAKKSEMTSSSVCRWRMCRGTRRRHSSNC